MRRKLAAGVGVVTFVAALAGFVFLGTALQSNEVRVLVASHAIAVGQVLQATTADLAPDGALVELGAGAEQDTIPERSYREVQGAVALVEIPAGSLILRSDLAMGRGSSLRQVTISLAFMPTGLRPGDRVDLFAVSGTAGGGAPGADLCGSSASAGCVVPLAQAVVVTGVRTAAHGVTIAVPPEKVAPWLLLDATESIWAVPAGAVSCEGTEQAISDPYQALDAIRRGIAAQQCSREVPAQGGG